MALPGVAEIGVIRDEYASITDLLQGAKAQVADSQLDNSQTATTPKTQMKSGNGWERKERIKIKFLRLHWIIIDS